LSQLYSYILHSPLRRSLDVPQHFFPGVATDLPLLYWDAEYAGTQKRWAASSPRRTSIHFAWTVPTGTVEPVARSPGQAEQSGGKPAERRAGRYVRVRCGGRCHHSRTVRTVGERYGRNGLPLFTYVETEWRNQNGEVVKAARRHANPLLAGREERHGCSAVLRGVGSAKSIPAFVRKETES